MDDKNILTLDVVTQDTINELSNNKDESEVDEDE